MTYTLGSCDQLSDISERIVAVEVAKLEDKVVLFKTLGVEVELTSRVPMEM